MKLSSISYFTPLVARTSVDLASVTHFLHLEMQVTPGAPPAMFADAQAKSRTIWL